jgi:excisionase family DNA binding protein
MTALITTAEAAQRLCVDRSVVIKLVARGQLLPAMKLPGRTGAHLFQPSEIDRYLAERAA